MVSCGEMGHRQTSGLQATGSSRNKESIFLPKSIDRIKRYARANVIWKKADC